MSWWDGANRPCSTALIYSSFTPNSSANSCWVKLRCSLRDRKALQIARVSSDSESDVMGFSSLFTVPGLTPLAINNVDWCGAVKIHIGFVKKRLEN